MKIEAWYYMEERVLDRQILLCGARWDMSTRLFPWE